MVSSLNSKTLLNIIIFSLIYLVICYYYRISPKRKGAEKIMAQISMQGKEMPAISLSLSSERWKAAE